MNDDIMVLRGETMIDEEYPVIEFSAHDRCDRCGAQAYARASRDELELLFCRHHIYEYNYALELDDWEVAFDVVGLGRLIGEDADDEVLV